MYVLIGIVTMFVAFCVGYGWIRFEDEKLDFHGWIALIGLSMICGGMWFIAIPLVLILVVMFGLSKLIDKIIRAIKKKEVDKN